MKFLGRNRSTIAQEKSMILAKARSDIPASGKWCISSVSVSAASICQRNLGGRGCSKPRPPLASCCRVVFTLSGIKIPPSSDRLVSGCSSSRYGYFLVSILLQESFPCLPVRGFRLLLDHHTPVEGDRDFLHPLNTCHLLLLHTG